MRRKMKRFILQHIELDLCKLIRAYSFNPFGVTSLGDMLFLALGIYPKCKAKWQRGPSSSVGLAHKQGAPCLTSY
jgi:hypothetical protein